VLGLFDIQFGLLGVVLALSVCFVNPTLSAIFDIITAFVSLVGPATGILGILVAYLEYNYTASKEET